MGKRQRRSSSWLWCAASGAMLASGCSHLKTPLSHEYVYVIAKQTFLRDRVAAVSNRTGTVDNGEALEVLEHGRRFLKVQTPKGEQGWIDEKATAPQSVFDAFESLKSQHRSDPSVASAVVRDEVYLHAAPGRDTDRLFRLPEGDKLTLIRRATLQKAGPPQARPGKVPPNAGPSASAAAPGKAVSARDAPTPAEIAAAATAPAMEDWWLIRDAEGRTGWLLSRMMDVDAPDALTRYAEGQRIVGAYVLTKANDPEIEGDIKDVPEYVTVLSPFKSGLPYDFDQVRVFIWNVRKHRYETAFRQRNIEGYLPVVTGMARDPYGKQAISTGPAPTFKIRVLTADAPPVIPDPATGSITPGKTIEKTYRLEGNIVRRVLPPGAQPPDEAHPEPEDEKPGKHKRRR